MPFSESLAARTRDALFRTGGVTERRMFGGLCFLLDGKILVAVRHDLLIARIGEVEAAKAVRKPYVEPMGPPFKPMKGWVVVDPDGTDTDRQLASWVEKAVAFVDPLPRK